ncbi:hypothetical protein VNO77_43291 [Canavalia gladiata]|uniref:Uncharacterized protein n=1 Tax=Canavalia gladiata TaxID=3824 RepID=A0AAN9JWI3_CANGL
MFCFLNKRICITCTVILYDNVQCTIYCLIYFYINYYSFNIKIYLYSPTIYSSETEVKMIVMNYIFSWQMCERLP